jgi:hypothetical protein
MVGRPNLSREETTNGPRGSLAQWLGRLSPSGLPGCGQLHQPGCWLALSAVRRQHHENLEVAEFPFFEVGGGG